MADTREGARAWWRKPVGYLLCGIGSWIVKRGQRVMAVK